DLGKVFLRGAELVHVTRERVRVLARRAARAVGAHVERVCRPRVATARAREAALRVAGLAVDHDGDVEDTGVDGRQGVVHVDLERAATYRGGVHVLRDDA